MPVTTDAVAHDETKAVINPGGDSGIAAASHALGGGSSSGSGAGETPRAARRESGSNA